MSTTVLNRLRAENGQLRRRLAEAEETLEAIRTGTADARVGTRPEGSEVRTLSGSETPYRRFVETMGEGAVTLAPDGSVAYANQRFALMVGTPLDRILGAPVARFLGPASERTFPAAVARCLDVAAAGEALPWTAGEFTLRTSDATIIPVFASLTALRMGGHTGVAAIFADMTESKQAEDALRNLNTILERRVAERTAELAQANQTIQAQNEELAAANEEMAAANEEMRVANESLRDEIAAREAAEIALAEAKEHYRTVADFTYDWEFWRAPDGGFLYVSPSCERVSGHTAREFIEDPGLFLRIADPADREAVRAHIEEAQDSGDALEIEFRLVRRDGAVRWIQHVCQPVLTDDGRFLGRRATNRDVTERKRAEEALRASEARLRDVARRARCILWSGEIVARPDWRHSPRTEAPSMAWNTEVHDEQAGQAILPLDVPPGWTYLAASAARRLPEDDARMAATATEALLGGAGHYAQEYRCTDRHGRLHWLHEEVTLDPTADGRWQAYGVVIDVTERRQAEAALRRANRTLRALHNSSLAMAQAADEQQYLDEVCRIVVEDCGHAMVWVGFAEDDAAKTVRPAAWSGFEQGYIETLRATWADTERGRGPTGTAIRTGAIQGCRDMLADPRFAPWREEAIRRGYASSLALPLAGEGRTFGALTLYAREPNAFSDEETRLLAELADDLAYGITTLRARAARERAETALRASEERAREQAARLQAVFDAAPALIWSALDPECRTIEGNRAAHEFSRTAEGLNLSKTGPAPDTLAHYRIFQDGVELAPHEMPIQHAAATGQDLRDCALDFQFDDGSVRSVLGNVVPVIDTEGRPAGAVSVFLDITERLAAQAERERLLEEVERQRAQLVAVLREMPAGVAIADAATGRIVLGNQRLAEIWRAPALPETLDEYAAYCKVLRADGCPCCKDERPLFLAVLEGAAMANAEMDILRADGTTGTVMMSAAPVRDRADRIVAAVLTYHDITELKHLQRALREANLGLERRVAERTEQLTAANEALRESEKRFVLFMDHFPGPAFVKDADGRYVFANEYFRRAFHCDPAQIIGQPDAGVFPPELAAHFRADDLRVIASGQSHEIVEVVPAEGAEATFLTTKFLILREGQPPLVGGIALDISDRKRLEREIVDVGQRTARRIGQDLHDTLGQHLTGMVFVTEALENKLERQGLPEAADAARIGALIGQAIRQTRALSRGLCPVQVEADGLMSALADFAESLAERAKVGCRFDCPRPVLLADTDAATHLFHIAQEAANNALKHGHATAIRIALTASGGEGALIVEDNGAGFALGQPRANKLGLHLMGYRASMIGGSLDVQSSPGKGTVVTCRFPRPLPPDPQQEARA